MVLGIQQWEIQKPVLQRLGNFFPEYNWWLKDYFIILIYKPKNKISHCVSFIFHALLFLREHKAFWGTKHETAWVIQLYSSEYGRCPIGNARKRMVIGFLNTRRPILHTYFLPQTCKRGINTPILQLNKLRYKDIRFPEVTQCDRQLLKWLSKFLTPGTLPTFLCYSFPLR